MNWMWHIELKLYSCINTITLKMVGLLAETSWWKYYKQKYIIKLKCFWRLFVHFINLINAQNMEHIKIT